MNIINHRTICLTSILSVLSSSAVAQKDVPTDQLSTYIVVLKTPDSHSSGAENAEARDATEVKILTADTGEAVISVADRIVNRLRQEQQLLVSRGESSVASEEINHKHIYQYALAGFSIKIPRHLVDSIKNDPTVQHIEKSVVVKLDTTQLSPPWGLDRIDQRNLPLNNFYVYGADGSGVHAYVIDSGLRVTHTQFTGRIGNGYDFIDNDSTPNDCHGHGTHVAGTIGGTTYGVAKNVTIHPVRVIGCDGEADSSDLIAGYNWVAGNRQLPAVANVSLGGSITSAKTSAVQGLWNSGVTVAVSAGNEGVLACSKSPANVPSLLTVAASNSADARPIWSNYGSCVDLFAPGVGIESAAIASDTSSVTWDGTSMAAPHVTGTAANILDDRPTFTPSKVSLAILASTTLNKITSPGAGTPNRLLYNVSFPVAIDKNGPSYGTFLAPSCNWILTSQTSVTIHQLKCADITVAQRVRHSGGCSISIIDSGFTSSGSCSSYPGSDNYQISLQ